MKFKEYFCNGACCKCDIHYFIGWIFFLLASGFLASFLYENPLHLDFGPHKNLFIIFINIFGIFLIFIFSRCICYKKEKEEEKEEEVPFVPPDLTYYN